MKLEKMVSVSFTEKDYAALELFAEAEDRKISAAARNIIRQYLISKGYVSKAATKLASSK